MKLSRDQSRRGWFLIVVLAAGMFGTMMPVAHAVTKTAVGTGTNDWFADATWSPSNPPVAGDDVIITNNDLYVFLTNATPYLGSLVISNRATLICSNWNTALSATNVSILTDAVLTCAGPFTNSVMSNRVYLICSNLTIDSGGKIDTDSKGYWALNGPGAGGGNYRGAGGGHGGWGGSSLGADLAYGGAPYDSASDPTAPGSGGGASYYINLNTNGGHGGGAVKIEAGGTVTVNGTITADGGGEYISDPVGGGSGGAISINCNTFAGTSNGLISADGGTPGSTADRGSGGGGRIAVNYTTMTPGTAVRFSTASGSSAWHESDLDSRWHAAAEWGTLYLADTTLLSSNMYDQLFYKTRLIIPDFSSWSPVSLTVSNCSFQLGTDGFTLNVTNDLVIIGTNGILWLGGDYQSATTTVNVGQNLVLTNGGALHVYSGNTNADNPNQGALVDVGQDIRISSGSWLYPYCQLTNGGSVIFRAQNVTIATNAGINAAGRGFEGNKGYGVGGDAYNRGGGGGHGGKGGKGDLGYPAAVGGTTYGLSNAPAFAGSGGGGSYYFLRVRACGGGMVRIEATNNVTADGTLSASGQNTMGGDIGGGSGGSILIMCNSFAGNVNGQLLAKGGSTGSSCGGGGGGRIAVWYKVPESVRAGLLAGQVVRYVITSTNYSGFEGTTSVSNGTGMLNPPDPDGAYPGTCVFLTYAPRGTSISIQ